MASANQLIYEWDKRKEVSNIKNHGVSFHEASTVFLDSLSMSFYDPDHSDDEDRFITLGMATTGKILLMHSQKVRADFSNSNSFENGFHISRTDGRFS